MAKPDIRRLARRGGVKRIQIDIYDTVRDVLKRRIEEVIPCFVGVLLHTLRPAPTDYKAGARYCRSSCTCYNQLARPKEPGKQ